MRAARFFFSLFTFTLFVAALALAQSSETGLPPFGSFHGSNFDLVSLKNGNLHVEIPLWSLPQRAAPNTGLRLVYDMPTWEVDKSHPTPSTTQWTVAPVSGEKVYWNYVFDPDGPRATKHDIVSKTCTFRDIQGNTEQRNYTVHVNYVMTDSHGTKHPFNLRHVDEPSNGCVDAEPSTDTGFALDGSGYKATVSANNGNSVQYQMADDIGQFNGNLGSELSTGGSTTIQTDANGVALYRIDSVLDSNGNTQQFRVDFGPVSSLTNFCPLLPFQPFPSGTTCVETGSTLNLPVKLTLPNGKLYQFTWSTDGNADLLRIDLPTGGYIAYTYETKLSTPPFQHGGISQYKVRRRVTSRTVNDGTSSQLSSYLAGGIVHDPLGNEQVHTFGAAAGGSDDDPSSYEVQVDFYQGTAASGQLLQTIKKDYLAETDPGLSDSNSHGTINARLIRTTTILGDAAHTQTKTETDYETLTDTHGAPYTFLNPIEQREFAYGAGASGTLLRRTVSTYLHTGNQNYLSRNIVHRVLSKTVYDGGGNQVAQTVNEYDNYSHPGQSMLASSAIQHDPAYDTNFIYRGNVTAVSSWRNTDGAMLTSTNQYDDAGNRLSTIDPLGHKTSFDYTDSWGNTSCTPVGQAKVFATTITNALSQTTTKSYNSCTATVASVTDLNAKTTTFAYDPMNRLKTVTKPDGGVTENTYDDTQLLVTSSTLITLPDSRIFNRRHYDQLGRVVKGELCEDGSSACATSIKTDTTYDGIGQISIISNPYRTANDPGPSNGITTTEYDGLGRVTKVIRQDGSFSQISYTGSCTITTDEAGKQRAACTDALGRLVEVHEPNPGSVATNATGSVTISGSEQAISFGLSISVANSGFETPSLGSGANAYQYHPAGSSWTFGANSGVDGNNNVVGGSGITGNNSGFTSSNPAAPEGAQVAFLQGGSANFISQSLSGFQAGVNYTVYFQAAQRGNFNAGGEDFDVYLDSSFLATFNPASTSYALLSTPAFTTTAGTHTIKFVGRDSAGGNGNAAFIDAVQVTGSVVIPNSGFEAPALGTGNFQYSPTGGSWTFGGTGISANGSTFTSGNPGAPQGGQVAFIQMGSNDVFSQALSGFQAGMSYTVSFSAAQRGNSSNGGQDFDVYLDTTLLGTFRPTSTSYAAMSTSAFTTTAGTHTLKFVGRDSAGGDNTAFIDAVQITGTLVIADAGTVTISVNGMPYSTSFGSGDTPATIASRLATTISAGSFASATASGGTVNLTSKTAGTIGDYSLTASSTWNGAQFTNPSFTASTSGAALSGAYNAGDIGNNPFVTLYSYDALGNLYCVEQHGDSAGGTACPATPPGPTDPPIQPDPNNAWRRRLFANDSLSRLRWASNPESGVITYSYDADGNLLQKTSPAPNQTGTATQTVSYCYDALHRVTGQGYGAQTCPLATPVVTYTYDSGTNGIGHLTSLADQAGTGSYTYDIMGRVATETRTLTGANNAPISKTLSYEYNLDGSVYKLHYPSGNVVTYDPGATGRALSAKDSGNNINYVTSATYAPDGSLAGFISGNSTSFAGITNAFTYNQRLQPINMSANAPSQTVFSIGYDFHVGNGTSGADNGNVFGITNYKDQTRNQTFTYDILNRLVSARNAGTDCTVTILGGLKKFWGNTYTYDAWGNLTTKALLQTPLPHACSGESLSVTAGSDNRLGSGYLYDAAGNMTFNATPPTQTYTYDQENRLTGAAGYGYTYDAYGNRVIKSNGSTGTLYWYMTPGIVGESDLSGNLTDEYVFFDGERVARKSTNGVFYYFSDHLKTASVITDAVGTIKSESDYYPWGGELQFVANDSNHYKFTGKERDAETQLDYFGARYYSNGLGRWVSADWSAAPVPVPYASFGDPQSLNQYSYVRNIPTVNVDTDGHETLNSVTNDRGNTGMVPCATQQCRDFDEKMGDFILNGFAMVTGPLGRAFFAAEAIADWRSGNKTSAVMGALAVVPGEKLVGSVWKLGNFARGIAIETALGKNLASGFPVIDRFLNGTATSIKSIDLTAKTYQDTEKLAGTLEKYVDKVSNFNGATYGNQTVKGSDIAARELQVAIPKGSMSAAQQKVFDTAAARAANLKNPVKLTVTQVQ